MEKKFVTFVFDHADEDYVIVGSHLTLAEAEACLALFRVAKGQGAVIEESPEETAARGLRFRIGATPADMSLPSRIVPSYVVVESMTCDEKAFEVACDGTLALFENAQRFLPQQDAL